MPVEPRTLTSEKLTKEAKEWRLTMSLETPIKIREFQRKLYTKAKQEPSCRFYLLYDKIHREDILAYAYQLAKANGGAPGVDDQSFWGIEAQGLENWLAGLRQELIENRYQPQAVRRVMIPKPNGGERPLGIPTVSANCTGGQIAFGMGGDPPSVPSASRSALPDFESTPNRGH
jgi:retron-type reverse transcriptase